MKKPKAKKPRQFGTVFYPTEWNEKRLELARALGLNITALINESLDRSLYEVIQDKRNALDAIR